MRIRKNQYSYSTARHFATNERNTLKFLQFVAKLLGFVYSKFYDNWLITSKVMSIYVGVKLENRLNVCICVKKGYREGLNITLYHQMNKF